MNPPSPLDVVFPQNNAPSDLNLAQLKGVDLEGATRKVAVVGVTMTLPRLRPEQFRLATAKLSPSRLTRSRAAMALGKRRPELAKAAQLDDLAQNRDREVALAEAQNLLTPVQQAVWSLLLLALAQLTRSNARIEAAIPSITDPGLRLRLLAGDQLREEIRRRQAAARDRLAALAKKASEAAQQRDEAAAKAVDTGRLANVDPARALGTGKDAASRKRKP